MNKTFLIIRQEFLRTIKRTGFIVLALSLPVIALLAIGVQHIVSGVVKPPPEVARIGYVDEVGGLDQFNTQGNITLVSFDSPEAAKQALINKDIKEYFVVPPDFISTGTINRYVTQRELAAPAATTAAIENFISSNLLAGKVPTDVITRVETPLKLATTTLTSTGAVAPQQGGYASFIVPGVFSFLLALSLIFTSTYVLQSLSEEKENRLMEILLSSVSTRQLLAGKVLGLGAAGLVQVVVWVISFPLLLNLASTSIGVLVSAIQVPASFWVLGVIYFILGYSLFAVLSASVAAVTSTVQEAQGLAAIYTVFNFAPFWFISLILLFPNSPVWIAFSIFPFTAPVVTMMRLGLTGVPVWQLAVSIAVLVLSIVGGLLLAARLLRTYILLYGKRPKLGEIIRNLRSA
jgi:ABC-2 type transport system permease protein